MGKSTGTRGHSFEQGQRFPPGRARGEYDLLLRALGGQLTNPPETAISMPEQQAISNAQGGFGTMARRMGVGATDSLLPGPGQVGGESRAELGLPPRRSYFPGMPTFDEAQKAGVIPPIRPATGAKKEQKRVKKGKELP